jgi:hypothetical protein
MQVLRRILAILVAVYGLVAGGAAIYAWQTGDVNRPELKAWKFDQNAAFAPQVAALQEEARKLEDAYPLIDWLVPRAHPTNRTSLLTQPDADWGDYKDAADAVSGFPSTFEEAAQYFAAAGALALIGGILVLVSWPRIGATFMVAALGTSLTLEWQRTPVFLMLPVGLLGLFVWITAPRSVKLPGEAEQQRLKALVARLPQGAPLEFQTSDAFALNLTLGFVMVVPGLMYWSVGKKYPAVIDGAGVTTRGGQRYAWTDLASASARSYRRRGWFIGRRIVRLEFTKGDVLLDEGGLKGPFAAVWNAFHTD